MGIMIKEPQLSVLLNNNVMIFIDADTIEYNESFLVLKKKDKIKALFRLETVINVCFV